MTIRKAVIPAAGFGTRFLPATKASPKEMLPVVDKPVIQYVVEEAAASGITDILIVTSRGKTTLENHFDRAPELEAELARKGKTDELETVLRPASLANIHFVRQHEMRGLGDAVSFARGFVGDEPFAVLLGDTLMQTTNGVPVTRQLMDVFARHNRSVVALEEAPRELVSRYGVIDGVPADGDGAVMLVRDLVEKPAPEDAPSNLVIASRYVLTPDIFDKLARVPPGRNGEIQLTDALREQARERDIRGLVVAGKRFDAGNKLDFIKTNVVYALERPDLRDKLSAFIIGLAEQLKRGGQ